VIEAVMFAGWKGEFHQILKRKVSLPYLSESNEDNNMRRDVGSLAIVNV
jgi:hypothetical protein